MDTVAAAVSQDYPADRFQVFVLDDGKSEELRQAVYDFNLSMERDYAQVVYLCRDKKPGVPHFYKSGNLRYGLETTQSLYGGSDYFAALDADVIPERHWLSSLVPYLTAYDELALVSPPQLSYNMTESDALGQDTYVFYQILEPLRDRFHVSHCSGSGYVMRRKAVDAIGGWPLVNVGEDNLCSYLLINAGWKTAFVQKELQFGLMPASFHAYISQRVRWVSTTPHSLFVSLLIMKQTRGSLIIAQRFRFFLPFLSNYQCSPMPQVFAFLHAIKAYTVSGMAIAMLFLPFLVLHRAIHPLQPGVTVGERHDLGTVFLVIWIANTVTKEWLYSRLGSRNMSAMSSNRFWTAPCKLPILRNS